MRSGTYAILCALMICLTSAVHAQTAIFNIPSADTLERLSVNIEADFLAKATKYVNGGYQTLGYRLAYGVTDKTEVGSNLYLTWDGGRPAADLEFSLKYGVYKNEARGISTCVGAIASVPLRDRSGDRTSVMTYGNISKNIKRLGGTTATAGVYHVFRGANDFGTSTGAMLGIVQPIKGKVSFVADWSSGQNRLGYASAGLNIDVTKGQYLLAGYSFGNSGRGNNALAVYYGITF